jgi:malate synthase
LNAANARWGSLYDALYGTDVISENDGAAKGDSYNPVRGAKVIAYARNLLDSIVPLVSGSYATATSFCVVDGVLEVTLGGGTKVGLEQASVFAGYQGPPADPSSILLKHHGIHIEIQRNAGTPIGQSDAAGISDVVLEAALSTILDLEDSVAVVDAEDKVAAYRNWLGLTLGTLTATFPKGSRSVTRTLNADRTYTSPQETLLTLPGRSLLFVRNVGHLMTNPAILDSNKAEIPEGILDAIITTTIALHDLKARRNSRAGSVYIVKPKMHGPAEVAFTDQLFARVETLLALPENTIKLGSSIHPNHVIYG